MINDLNDSYPPRFMKMKSGFFIFLKKIKNAESKKLVALKFMHF